MTLTKDVASALQYLIKADEKFHQNNEWSVREKLALASAVIDDGQEYWPSISRNIQSFGSNQRKEDKSWCSSKECAKQYSKMIDNIEKKKRSDNNNSTIPLKELIVKKLTVERIEELQQDIRKEQEKQSALKELLINLESGKLDDSVTEIWTKLKENNDFVQYVTCNNEQIKDKKTEKELESETTDAMTSSCVEDDSNSDKDDKPRLVLHLKKTSKRLNENTENDNENGVKSPKTDSDKESYDSCDTEPAIYLGVNEENAIIPTDESEDNMNMFNAAWIKKSKSIIAIVIDDPNCHLFDTHALSKKDPKYKKIIKHPINLIDIRNHLRDNLYITREDFEHDILLVICNAVLYYPINSTYNKIVRSIYDKVSPLLECLHDTDNDSYSSAEPKTRRRTRKCALYK